MYSELQACARETNHLVAILKLVYTTVVGVSRSTCNRGTGVERGATRLKGDQF